MNRSPNASKNAITGTPTDNVCVKVPHIMQTDNWDCGLACAKMIINYIHPDVEDGPKDFSSICEKMGFGKSIWTIDLAHLVRQYDIQHKLCTITLGVDPTYQDVNFYSWFIKDDFMTEQQRVNQLFVGIEDKGVEVEKRSVTTAEIVNHLSSKNPAVVLVDNSILQCEWCSDNTNSSKEGCGGDCLSLCDSHRDRSFVGHFIVLCGLDITKKCFLYRDPGIPEDLCCCSFTNLDEARKSHGTDEDILFVYG